MSMSIKIVREDVEVAIKNYIKDKIGSVDNKEVRIDFIDGSYDELPLHIDFAEIFIEEKDE